MTDKPTQKEMDDLFVEETGFDPDDFPAAIFGFARAVLAKWGQPAQAVEPPAPRGDPVAWLNPWRADQVTTDYDAYGRRGIPLYTAPQPSQAQAGEYPALVCDYCEALTPDPWHSSGMLHGKMSKHIHSCDACAARGAARAQDTREPLTPEQIQDLLLCGNPTDEEMRLIRIGWDAAHGIKGGQHGTE